MLMPSLHCVLQMESEQHLAVLLGCLQL